MNTAFVSGVLLASLIPSLALVQRPALTTAAIECENVHAHEPMLVYEVAGSTLTGVVDRTLIIYSDGVMKLTSAVPGEPGTCITLQTTTNVTTKLYRGLAEAGALTLCDDDLLAIDMPLHTLTLLRGAYDMRGRTISFWNINGAYGVIGVMMEDFIAEQFGS